MDDVEQLRTDVDGIINNTTIIRPNANESILVGSQNATALTSTQSVIIGKNAKAVSKGVAIGYDAMTTVANGGVAVGDCAETENGVAIGREAEALGDGVAIGNFAETEDGIAIGGNEIKPAQAFGSGSVQIGGGTNYTDNTLQVGDDNIYNYNTHTMNVQNLQINGVDVKNELNSKASREVVDQNTVDIGNLQSSVSQMAPKVARALLTPMSAPVSTELVAVDDGNSQTMIEIGNGLQLENGTLKLSQQQDLSNYLLKSGGDVGSLTFNAVGNGLTFKTKDGVEHFIYGDGSTNSIYDRVKNANGTYDYYQLIDGNGKLYSNKNEVITKPDLRTYQSLIPAGSSIPANADLNTPTYLTVGNHYCQYSSDAQTLVNSPTKSAFLMTVYSPLSTALDTETTSAWIYRVRKILTFQGDEYIQYAYTSGTANVYTYEPWKQIINSAGGTITGTITKEPSNSSPLLNDGTYALIDLYGTADNYTMYIGTQVRGLQLRGLNANLTYNNKGVAYNTLSNVTYPANTVGSTTTGAGDRVIETYISPDGKTWYRKWASGWKECGCSQKEQPLSSYEATIDLPLDFSSENYTLNLTPISGADDSFSFWILNKTVGTFTWRNRAGSGALSYYACGY